MPGGELPFPLVGHRDQGEISERGRARSRVVLSKDPSCRGVEQAEPGDWEVPTGRMPHRASCAAGPQGVATFVSSPWHLPWGSQPAQWQEPGQRVHSQLCDSPEFIRMCHFVSSF